MLSAVDNNGAAAATYRLNHPEVLFLQSDIASLSPEDLLPRDRKTALPDGRVDLLVVCAPCQPFSSQNRHKKRNENERFLILQAVRFAEWLKPALIFFENVPGLTLEDNAGILADLRSGLNQAGYTVGEPLRINAADYNVPQRRIRCILFASRTGVLPVLPAPASGTPRRTVAQAISDLPPLQPGEKSGDPLHFARNHLPVARERLRHIPKNGGSRFSLPPELELPCHRGHTGHPDVYGRMRWDDVAPTLTTGCTDITRGRFVHPRDDRAISLREAARLQTFPDDYVFTCKASAVAEQIGNAVPVELARTVGDAARAALAGAPAPLPDGKEAR